MRPLIKTGEPGQVRVPRQDPRADLEVDPEADLKGTDAGPGPDPGCTCATCVLPFAVRILDGFAFAPAAAITYL